MAIELEGLEFTIDAKSDGASKNIDALANSLGKLKNATKGLQGLDNASGKLGKLNEALESFRTEKLEKLSNSLQALNNAGNVKISASIPKRISDIAAASKQLNGDNIASLERLGNALQSVGATGNIRMPKLQTPNTVASTPTGSTTPATSGIGKATSQVQEVSNKLASVAGQGSRLKSILSGIGGVFSKGFNVGVGALKRLDDAMGSAASSAKQLIKKAAMLPVMFGSKLAANVKKTTTTLGSFLSSLKRIAMYRAVRAAIAALAQGFREGISNLYQYSLIMGGTFAGSMDKLATSSQYLKNSLGAMASPIINALAPAIDFLVDKIVTLLNYVNMLFARLSGATSFTAAKKSAKAFGKAVGGAGGAAKKAAKEIRDATLGIDELNIIMQKDSAGSGAGAGGGTDYGSMFEELPIDKNISDFADRLKEAFENADWKTLGTLLGEKVNELMDSVDWSGIGHKIGFAINGAVQTAYWFLDTVNFKKIGAHIAELLNGALKEIDFSFVGRLITKPFTSVIDLIIGFLSELDWGLVAKSLSDLIIGMYDELTKWLNSYDWSEVGKIIWQKIKDLVTNIDYAGLVKSIFTFLGTAIRSAVRLLGGFFGSIAKDIKAWWDKDIKGADWKETASNLLKAIGKGFVNIGTWVWKNIISPFGQALLGESWDNVKQVGANILAKVKKGWDAVCQLTRNIGQFFVNVKNDASKWWSNVQTWWGNQVGAVKEFFTNVHNGATDWWSNVKTWWSGKVGAVKQFTTSVANQASTWWNNVKTWWSNKVGKVQEFTTHVTNQASVWWSNVKTWWSDKVGKVQEFTTHVANQSDLWWSHVKEWWSGRVGKVKEFTTHVTNQAALWWSNVKTWWSGKVGKVQEFTTHVTNQASQWWSNVKTWWSGKVGAVQQFTTSVANQASQWWSNVKSWWSGRVGAVKNFTTNVVNQSQTWWSNVKTWWSGRVGAVQNFTVGVANQASQWWSNVKTWWSNAVGTLWATLNIKLPHVRVSWKKDPFFGKVDIPSFGVEWYAKGGILDGAQLFGRMGNSFLGGGEAGQEAVLPLERHTQWMDTLADKVRDGLPGESDKGNDFGIKQVLEYLESLETSINRMAADMKRQADKSESTTVQIGNKTITDAVVMQQNADGYRFVR